jgi:hypothetical protein
MLLTNFDRSTVLTVVLGLTASSIIYFVVALIKHRRFYNDLVCFLDPLSHLLFMALLSFLPHNSL